jgi:hypothetical protein
MISLKKGGENVFDWIDLSSEFVSSQIDDSELQCDKHSEQRI